jgi:site-specific DNA recombinase
MQVERKAVIYCRVSDPKQVRDGHGLSSQTTRCNEYAQHKGYEVVEIFHEGGVSGKLLDRPQMQAMLAFLKKHKRESYVVIIDDISRLARNIEAHIKLRAAIADAGAKLESPSIEFGEDSDSRLVEHLLASVAAHQREKNAEQVKNRMRARAQNGYWIFHAPIGYKYESMAGQGRILVRDEPIASIVQEALESFVQGRFETVYELKRFFESRAEFPKNRQGEVHHQRVFEMLDRVHYAGYIHIPEWGIHFQPGKHKPIISFETWQKLQQRLKGNAHAPARADISDEFPLRGFVTCADCGQPMTSCWSKGRSGKYPYYLCRQKGCASNGKSVRKEKIEGDFEVLLQELRPSPNLFFLACGIFQKLWDGRIASRKEETQSYQAQIRKLEQKKGTFLERIVQTENPVLLTTYENEISKLEEERVAIREKIENCGRPLKPFDETFRTAMSFLSNPHGVWLSDNLEYKRTVLKMVFAEPLHYDRKEGFRTAALSQPFWLLEQLKAGKEEMVLLIGFEPTTLALRMRCSTPELQQHKMAIRVSCSVFRG